MLRFLSILLVSSGLIFLGCQTSMTKQFSKLKPGMEKDDVLDVMGSPSQTQRMHGKDRWTYVFYEDRIRFEKEIQFFDGNAIYIGEIWQPAVDKSAVAMDTANEIRNRSLDEEMQKDIVKNRRAYEDYENHTKGTDKVRYVPRFVPVR